MNFYLTRLKPLRFPINILAYIWASPNTLFGLALGCLLGARPKHFRFHQGTIGIYGPGIARILGHCPIQGGAWAMTLGHTILACDEQAYKLTFSHEYVHVRQYEWLGPFFIPIYFGESAWQWCRGRRAYIDNRLEVQARKYA